MSRDIEINRANAINESLSLEDWVVIRSALMSQQDALYAVGKRIRDEMRRTGNNSLESKERTRNYWVQSTGYDLNGVIGRVEQLTEFLYPPDVGGLSPQDEELLN